MTIHFFDKSLFCTRIRAILLLMLLCCILITALSQQLLGVPTNEEDIQQALVDLTPVAGNRTAQLPFSRRVTVAIAFEQTHSWKSPTADRLRQLLPDAAGKQSFAALQQLIADGDTAGAVALQAQMRAGAIPPAELTAGMQLLLQEGFKQAFDALLVSNCSCSRFMSCIAHLI